MATKIGSLFGDVSLSSKNLDKDIAKISKDLSKVGKKLSSTGKSLSMSLTAPIAGFAALAVKQFSDFETSINEVRSLLPDMDQGEFERMKSDIRELSVGLGVDLVESTQALYQAISAGIPKDNVLAFLEAATKTGIAGLTSTEKAVDALTTIINAYGFEAEDAEKVSDILFTAVKGGKTTFDELADSLFQVAPLAAALDVPLEEVVGAVTTLTKQGTPTRQAMTQIRQGLVALQKPTADMETALGTLGVTTGSQLLGEKGLQGAFQAIRTEAGLTEQQFAKAVGSVEAMQAVLGLSGANFNMAVSDLESMTQAAGAMNEAFEIIDQGVGRTFKKLFVAVNDLAVSLGEILTPVLTPIVETITEWIRENDHLVEKFAPWIIAIGLAVAALGPLLAVLGPIVSAVAALIPLFAGLGPVIGVVATAAGILLLVWDEAWALGEKLGDMLVWLWEKWDQMIAIVKDVSDAFSRDLLSGMRTVWNYIRSAMISVIDRLFAKLQALWNFFVKVANAIGGFVGGATEALGGLIEGRANGGPVTASTPYIIGERGPELFVPSTSGTVVPNEALGGQTFNLHFAAGTDMAVVAAIKNMKPQLMRMAVDAVSDDYLRGGKTYKAIGA